MEANPFVGTKLSEMQEGELPRDPSKQGRESSNSLVRRGNSFFSLEAEE